MYVKGTMEQETRSTLLFALYTSFPFDTLKGSVRELKGVMLHELRNSFMISINHPEALLIGIGYTCRGI